MLRTSEVALNSHLAEVLRSKHPLWRSSLHVEQTGIFAAHPRLRPDILIQPPNAQPVVVETEYAPATSVEVDAKTRLGLVPLNSKDPVEQVIAVRIPELLRRDQAGLTERIVAAEFDFCMISGDSASLVRWPTAGWLTGGIDEIVRCIEHAMVSQRLVGESIKVLEEGVRVATRVVQDAMAVGFTDTEPVLGKVLNQHPGEQTTRMAMTIITNALTFQAMVAGTYGIQSVDQFPINTDSSIKPEPTLGGRAWPNFRVKQREWEEAVVLWANSTLGLISFWWIGSRQQQGRAMLTISKLPSIAMLEVSAFPLNKLKQAKEIFQHFRNKPLLPANEAYRDGVRHELDRAVLVDLHDLPEAMLSSLDTLRRQWCAEPSVHGGKSTAM